MSEGILDENTIASLYSLLEICNIFGVDPLDLNRKEILTVHVDPDNWLVLNYHYCVSGG